MIDTAALREVRIVEVFADVSCPFTHVGLRRLVEQRTRLHREDVTLRIKAWPLELVNGAALTGDFVGEEIEGLQRVVAPDLFQGFDRMRFPKTTIPALALAAAAYRESTQQGEAVSLALRAALFEGGRDVSDHGVLAAIGGAHGVAPPGRAAEPAVRDDWREGVQRGVIGSPHFFVGAHGFFCPTLDITRIDGHLHVEFDQDAFEAFVGSVFEEPKHVTR